MAFAQKEFFVEPVPVPVPVAEAPSILSMIFGSGIVVQSVLIILIALSVWSWAITIAKIIQFRRAQANSEEFSQVFWESRNFARIDESSRRLTASPLVSVFSSGYRELLHTVQEGKQAANGGGVVDADSELGTVERALRRAELEETHRLERGVTFLASVASAAPFIGLFGTVWGIMNAFHGLSQAKSTTIQAVAPGISEALVATAVGLAAAIPAAVAFNYFTASIKKFRQLMDSFSEEFLNIARRYFVK
jgi:biopolymer transport protein TolQ